MNTFDLLSLGYSMPRGIPNFNSLVNESGRLSGFGSQLAQLFGKTQLANNLGPARSSQVERITIYMPGENCIYTGGMKGERINQNVYVEYTEDSTEDDPIVRIRGEADSGHFDFICHINDIDPRNASYAEMSALYGYLVKTGAFGDTNGAAVTPCGYEFFGSRDMLKKQDFIANISALSVSDRINPRGRVNAKYMLGVYQDFMQRGTDKVTAAQESYRTADVIPLSSGGYEQRLANIRKLHEETDYSGMSDMEKARLINSRFQEAFGSEYGVLVSNFYGVHAGESSIYARISAEQKRQLEDTLEVCPWDLPSDEKHEFWKYMLGYEGLSDDEIRAEVSGKYSGGTLADRYGALWELDRMGLDDGAAPMLMCQIDWEMRNASIRRYGTVSATAMISYASDTTVSWTQLVHITMQTVADGAWKQKYADPEEIQRYLDNLRASLDAFLDHVEKKN